MKTIFTTLLLSASLLTAAFAQQIPAPTDSLPPCGTSSDFLERNIDPQLLKQMNAQWQAHQQKSKTNGRVSADDQVLVVPVMFHIAHLGEAVGTGINNSEGSIQAALATLNNIYRARGSYAQANDTKIEFVLANCSGIDRANASGVPEYSSKGVVLNNNNQQQQIKQLFGTYQDKFVNIYVVSQIDQAGGFAWYGGDMFISQYDFPKLTERSASSLTFAHEMGHVLFLGHTFSGDNSGYPPNPATTICPANGNPLSDGDQVADTPPHRVFDLSYNTPATDINFCTGEPYGIGLVKNHMAYYNNSDRFTPGQIERMRFYLQNYLTKWLNSDALPNPNNQLAFTSVPSSVCANAALTVAFNNNSGSNNPVFLIQKGDEVVYYVDNAHSPRTFNFPANPYGLNYGGGLSEGNDYKIKVLAGCNSKESASIAYNNLDTYTAAIVDSNGEEFPNTYQDVYRNICTGASLTLRIKLTYQENGSTYSLPPGDYASFNYQWMLNGNTISGATNSTYTVNGSAGTYRCVLTKPACANQSKNSYAATLNFYSSPSSYISDVLNARNQLRNQCTGSTIKLSSSYVSNSATYKWYKDGTLLANETGRTLNTVSSGVYKVEPSDGSCAISVSSTDVISLHIGNAIESYFSSSSDSLTCNGIYLNGPATGTGYGNGWAVGLTYQWLRNGSEIPGATQSSYFPSADGLYSLKVRQGTCESISNGKRIYQATKNQKPVLSAPAFFASGVIYRIYIDNPGNSGMQWLKDGQPVTSNYYNSLDISTSGVYKVRKGYGDCAIDSDPLPVVFGQSLAPTITASDPTVLTCTDYYRSPYLSFNSQYFVNTNGFTFRWLKDGVELPLSNFYADKNYLYPFENGQYRLRVTIGAASGLSNPITVSSASNHSIALTAQNSTTEACQGNVIKLSIPNSALSGYSSTSWIWRRNGTIIPNQSTNTLAAIQSGTYTATYQGDGCSVTSGPIAVKVGGSPLSATLSGQYAIRSGGTANLQLTSSTKGPYFFTLSDGTEYLGQALTLPIPKSPTVSTTYTLTSFGTHCGPSPNATGLARIDVTNCAIGIVNATLSGGTWNTPAIWSCGSVPTVLDAVRISQPHTIALPANYTATAKNVELEGNVQYNANAKIQLGQ